MTSSVFSPQGQKVIQRAVDMSNALGFDEITKFAYQYKDDIRKVYAVASPCKSDNGDMKGIQRVIKNLQNAISSIQRFSNLNSAVDALINEDVEPGKTIKKILGIATTDIAGYVKNIMGKVRGWVLNSVQNEAKKILPFLFPGEMPSFIDKLNKGTNLLSCAFAKIIRGLGKLVGNLLLGLIDKFINGPMCLAEDFVADLLNNITGSISAAINSANALLGAAAGAISGIGGAIFNAIDFATGILNFFKCDDDKKCPTQNEISRSGDASDTSGNTGDAVSTTTSNGNYASGQDVGTSGNSATVDGKTAFDSGGVDWSGQLTPEQRQEAVESLDLK
jgi:hypothetical protein